MKKKIEKEKKTFDRIAKWTFAVFKIELQNLRGTSVLSELQIALHNWLSILSRF